MSEERKLYMGKPRSEFVTRLITRDEWKLVCKIREADICASKTRFPTKNAGLAEVIRRMNRIENPSPRLNVYNCPVCGERHLTSRPRGAFKDPSQNSNPDLKP